MGLPPVQQEPLSFSDFIYHQQSCALAGDKTFCIAAVMAMRYNRVFVFGGAIGALIVMTVLSVVIGECRPVLAPVSGGLFSASLSSCANSCQLLHSL